MKNKLLALAVSPILSVHALPGYGGHVPLSEILDNLAKEAGIQLIYVSSDVDNVLGELATAEDLSPGDRLKAVLDSAGLSADFINERTVRIYKESDVHLVKMSVTNEQETSTAEPARIASTRSIEEVVVTAQRRTESLQDVPIAVTVLTQANLTSAGVSGTDQLQATVPGLTITRNHGSAITVLRGIGTTDSNASGESSVAYYVDGVYRISPNAQIMDFNNVERIEVLRGPQGTLFGRNATGGLIQVITKDPSQEFSSDLSLGYGSYKTFTGNAYVTGGITDTLAIDFAGYFKDQGRGMGRNLYDGSDVLTEDAHMVRSKLLWEPSESTALKLALDYSKNEGDFGNVRQPLPGTFAGGIGVRMGYSGDYRTVNLNYSPQYKLENYGIDLQVRHNFREMSFKSITSYRRDNVFQNMDTDGTPFSIIGALPFDFETDTYTQEFQLLSDSDSPLQWIAGIYYLNSDVTANPARLAGDFGAIDIIDILNTQETESYSVFGEVSYEITENTKVTLGARFTEDERRLHGHTVLIYEDGSSMPLPYYDVSEKWSEPTWRALLDHRLNDQVMVYTSYVRGFKSGVFNGVVSGASPTPPVEPEIIDSYEVGMKSDLMEGQLRVNLAAFYYKWENQQFLSSGGGAIVQLFNAAESSAHGVEGELSMHITDRFSVSASASWLDANYDKFPTGVLTVPRDAPDGGNLQILNVDHSGNTLLRAPKFTSSMSGSYFWPIEFGDISATVSYYYNDGFYWDADNRVKEGAYGLLSAELKWMSPSEKYGIRLNGANLTDTEYASSALPNSNGDLYSPTAPRTFSITFLMSL